MDAETELKTTQGILGDTLMKSPSHTKPISDGYEQVQQIYQDLFGVDPLSPLNTEYIRSGQLLNDIYHRIFPDIDINENSHQHKLHQLIQIIEPNPDPSNTTWRILLPEHHHTDTLKWDQLLDLFRVLKYYTSNPNKMISEQSTPTQPILDDDNNSNSNHSDAYETNQNINVNDNNHLKLKSTSYTPPLTKCSNLLQTKSFLTEQQHRPFRRIHFADSNIIHEVAHDTDGEAKAFSEDVDETSTTCSTSLEVQDTKPFKAKSPPRNQILMSAKKVMSEIRGKNLDAAMLASGRKVAQNVMPRSRKTKRCTPGVDRNRQRNEAALRLSQIHKCKLTKRLSFVHEDEQNENKPAEQIQEEEPGQLNLPLMNEEEPNDDTASITSHYGWKSRETSREQSKELNISMLSHVLVDKKKEEEDTFIISNINNDSDDECDELKDKIEELEIEISNKILSIQEYEKKLTEKSSQCRRLQQDMKELKTKHDELSVKCQLLEQIRDENETIKSQIATLMEDTASLKKEKETLQTVLNTKTTEYEQKCSSFAEELMKKEQDIKEKQMRNMNAETELKTLQAKLEIFKSRQSKMGQLELCKSKLLGFTADYVHLKDDVRFLLQKTSQEFMQTIETIKHGIQHGLLDPNVIQHDTYESIAFEKSETETKAENDLENITSERDELKNNLLQLNVSYQEEKKLRKKLLEQIIDLKGTIRVFCRVRPKVKRKATENATDAEVELMATTCLDDERIVINNESTKKEFNFDRIYQPGTAQDTVFEDVRPLIHSCVDGYNVCIFAYGQTGSGKTYTMEGGNENPGVIYRSFDELFLLRDKQNGEQNDNDMKVYLSCLEIYNEKIRDLLQTSSQSKALKAKLSKCGKKVLVPGLTKTEVLNTHNVRDILINTAYRNRSTGVTNMNEHSSRSHALVFVDLVTSKTSSRLVLIDLAGSERVKKTGVSGVAFDEARAINKSLSALGNVINSLQTKQKHVPFRDSQLTYLLYDCLGGQSRALMFCNISCEVFDVKESINTLLFANRVRRVQLGEAQKNDVNEHKDKEIKNNNRNDHSEYKQKLKKFKKDLEEKDKEINHMKMNLRNYQKEIKSLSSSIDAQNNKNSNHHQTRVEFNTLQKEHTRMMQEANKKDKLIKKLSNEVTDYKYKVNQLKQKNHLQNPRNRNKNPRKRKLPKDNGEDNDNDEESTGAIQPPQQKRRKMNHYGYKPNQRNYRNKENKTKQSHSTKNKQQQVPSYLAPTRNFKKTNNKKKHHVRRARSNSLDNGDKNKKDKLLKKKDAKEGPKTRRNRVNSVDSVVSLSGALNEVTNTVKVVKEKGNMNKSALLKADAPLTPTSAIEALKGRVVNNNKVVTNNENKTKGAQKNSKKDQKKTESCSKRKTNHVPITVSSLQIQSTKSSNVWK